MFRKVTCLVILLLASLWFVSANAQTAPATKSKKPVVTPEEKVVRAAYEKLTKLNKAALLLGTLDSKIDAPDSEYLRFELTRFHVGPITEILGSLHDDLITTKGELVDLTRSTTNLNNQGEHIAFAAQWTKAQYASIDDPKWTMRDILSFESQQYYDVGEYASYEVTVFYKGKSRSYKALALFHNAYGSTNDLMPAFWDVVVGSGGTLTEVWKENLPAVGEKIESESHAFPKFRSKAPSDVIYRTHHSRNQLARIAPSLNQTVALMPEGSTTITQSYSDTESILPDISSTTEDFRDHSAGSHGMKVGWRASCTALTGNEQYCKVEPNGIFTWENGTTDLLFYIHRNRDADKDQSATGPRGQTITCYHGRGLATRYCLNPNCTFDVSLTGSGLNIKMSGGDVWNGEVAHSHTCAMPSATNNCNNVLAKQKCLMNGGDWDTSTCRCSILSPILIDINGDGFALTDQSHGVSFDLNADGQPDQIGWTTRGSDNAWLAFDRNGNGRIDNGSELFGNATPQPPAIEPNGFLALEQFDRPVAGGNGDGWIGPADTVFDVLRLWQDVNHNGISEPSELHRLTELGIRRIELDYRTANRTDEYGNRFRFRAKVKDTPDAQVGRWAWDVYLVH